MIITRLLVTIAGKSVSKKLRFLAVQPRNVKTRLMQPLLSLLFSLKYVERELSSLVPFEISFGEMFLCLLHAKS